MDALSGPVIRRARHDDLAALHALVERAYRGDESRGGWTHEADILGGKRIDAHDLAGLIADPARVILVAEEADTIVGSVEIADRGGGLAYLGMLSVDPVRQAGGLGRRLMAAGEQAARDFGATRIEMTVIAQRAELIAWYRRRGYRLTAERRPFPHAGEGLTFLQGAPPAMAVLERDLAEPSP